MTTVSGINPAVLIWARETAGLSLEEAAHGIGLLDGRAATGAEKLAAIEGAERAPTVPQLSKMAAAYRRPLLALYMAEPPRAGERGDDFRGGEPAGAAQAARLDALLRDVRVRHAILRELAEDDEDAKPLPFVGSIPLDLPVTDAAGRVRAALGIGEVREERRRLRDVDGLFADLRRRAEALGVYVILVGDLGHHTTAIEPSTFRGFALADPLAPLVVINDKDAKAARPFTLVHELVHIFLGRTGISGEPSAAAPATSQARVERFCNDVAGEVLLPPAALAGTGQLDSAEALLAAAGVIAQAWRVSEAMAAYRLWRHGNADAEAYRGAYAILRDRWRRHRERERQEAAAGDGGPNPYVIWRQRLGQAVLLTVGRALRADALTHTTAAKVFGVKPGLVEPLLAGVAGLGGAAARRRA